MTRKDYQLIAEVIANLNADFNTDGEDTVSLSLVAKELAEALETDNPRFDRNRFLVACGVTSDLSQRMFTPQGELLN
jgi:hypothetical protein